MRVLIFGSNGMLGSDLVSTAPSNVELGLATIDDVDITSLESLHRLASAFGPDWIINAAAYTNVDAAESDSTAADMVNGTALGYIGKVAADLGSGVMHYSTDYVFNGEQDAPYDEFAPTDPVNAYGRSKLLGEHALRASGAPHLILRTQWLFGVAGRSFPRTMHQRALGGLPTRVVDDQFGRPTYTVDLALASWRLLGAEGLYHVSNEGRASWFDLASPIFRRAGVPHLLTPCKSSEYPTPARRPRSSALSTSRLQRDHDLVLPPWEDALERFLTQLDAAASA